MRNTNSSSIYDRNDCNHWFDTLVLDEDQIPGFFHG
jgi:hypothetical protein